MKLILLGLLILLIVICQIYKIIKEKEDIVKETFDFLKNYKKQRKYYKHNLDYYKKMENDGELELIKNDISKKTKIHNFMYLDGKKKLVETFVPQDRTREVEKNINICRSLTKCEQLKDHPQCGYCGSTNRFEYNFGRRKNIGPDVCPPDENGNNMWSLSMYDCNKIQNQKKCSTIKSCTQMQKGTELGELCAWCPSDSTAKVATKGKKALLMYDGFRKGESTSKIKSDECPYLGAPDPEYPDEGPLFDELIRAGNCSACDEPNEDGESKGHTGTHSRACLNSLWQSPYSKDKTVVQCTTDYDDEAMNSDIKMKYDSMNKPYFKVIRTMQRQINRPLKDFYNKFQKKSGWEVYMRPEDRPVGYTRRKKNLNNIDKLWKQCFGKNREDEIV